MEKDLVTKDSGDETSGLQFVPTCWEGHPLKLGQNSEESSGYICNGCGVAYSAGTPVWRCDKDPRRGGSGTCEFDLCVSCMEKYGVEYIAAWPVLRKLARMMRRIWDDDTVISEEDLEKFKRMIEPISPQMVDQVQRLLNEPSYKYMQDENDQENLAQIAGRYSQTGFLQILLDQGMDTIIGERLRKLAKLVESEDDSEQDEMKDLLAKVTCNMLSTTNIDNCGTLLQRAARLERAAKVNLILEAGADPGALAEGDDDLNPDDNVPPILIAIKKNNWTIYGNIRRKMYKYENEAEKYYDETLFNFIKWVRPNVAKNQEDYEKFKSWFKGMVDSAIMSVQGLSENCIRGTGTLLQEAVRQECRDFIEILIHRGVDPNFVTENGELRQSPFEMAAEKDPELSQFLKLQFARRKLSLLMSQDDESEKAKDEFAELLLTIPAAELEGFSVTEKTFLQDAVCKDKTDLVRQLLKHGVNPNGVTAKNDATPLKIALMSPTNFKIVSLLAEYMEFPEPQKLQYLVLMLQTDKKVSLEDFKKCLKSVPLEKLNKEEIEFEESSRGLHHNVESNWSYEGVTNERKVKGTWVQYAATRKQKVGMLQILLDAGLDPNSVVEYESEASCNALEIAAMNRNEPAFNLLAPHYDDDLKKKVARLVLIGLAEKTPSEEFKTLLSSIPMHKLCESKKKEDLEEAILACVDPDQLLARESKSSHNSPEQQVAMGCVQGANLLQIFSMKGKTPFVTYLLEQGFNPGATTKAEPKPAMYQAWLYNNISTMVELAKYTQPSSMIRKTEVWAHVEKEKERNWQMEMTSTFRQQNKLLSQLMQTKLASQTAA